MIPQMTCVAGVAVAVAVAGVPVAVAVAVVVATTFVDTATAVACCSALSVSTRHTFALTVIALDSVAFGARVIVVPLIVTDPTVLVVAGL